MSTESIVYIIDDNDDLRQTLCTLLATAGIESAGFRSAEAFLEGFDPERPGCALLDMIMKGMSGLALQKELQIRGSILEIIFLTAYGDVASAVEAMKLGAFDFLEKPFANQDLLDLVRHAIDKSLGNYVARTRQQLRERRFHRLTGRERQVMGLMAVGKTNKMIALDLGISVKTVEIHRANVMKKSGCRSIAELVALLQD